MYFFTAIDALQMFNMQVVQWTYLFKPFFFVRLQCKKAKKFHPESHQLAFIRIKFLALHKVLLWVKTFFFIFKKQRALLRLHFKIAF